MSSPVKVLALHDLQSYAARNAQKAMAYHADPTHSHVPSFQIESSEYQPPRLPSLGDLLRVSALEQNVHGLDQQAS
jgi:hypothetical protein